jgi:hypothetical protein
VIVLKKALKKFRFLAIITFFICNLFVDLGSSAQTSMRKRPVAEDPVQSSVTVFYGQSRDVWDTVHDVKSAQGNIERINDILQQKYGTYEEAMSTLGVRMDGFRGFDSAPLLKHYWIEVGAEADAFGLVRNPVVPELHANAVMAGIASFGFEGKFNDPGLKTRLGIVGGSGYEKRIDAFSTDLIDKLPVRNGHLYFYGLEQDLSMRVQASQWELSPRLSAHEINFETAVAPSSLDVMEGNQYFAFRWKAQFEATHEVSIWERSRGGVVAVVGPQPLPVDVLPRVWDYSHRMQSFPEVGAMLGGGVILSKSWSRSSSWNNVVGFFGGYWGGESSLQLGAFRANVGTWGIEASSAYRTLGQRIWTAGLGVGF